MVDYLSETGVRNKKSTTSDRYYLRAWWSCIYLCSVVFFMEIRLWLSKKGVSYKEKKRIHRDAELSRSLILFIVAHLFLAMKETWLVWMKINNGCKKNETIHVDSNVLCLPVGRCGLHER